MKSNQQKLSTLKIFFKNEKNRAPVMCETISDHSKYPNIRVSEFQEDEERQNGGKNFFEKIISPNFQNLVKQDYLTSPGSTEKSLKESDTGWKPGYTRKNEQ